jgi:Fic family protein
MEDENRVRHSKAADAALVTDENEKAHLEASNALRQAERVRQYILSALDSERPFKLRPSTLLDLNRRAIEGLDAYAGLWRPAAIEIGKSEHTPPESHLVPEAVEDMCDYVNENWASSTAVHICSFVMWRLNWIHPFTEGNGRTSRAASYLVLCARSGALLPGKRTIPEQIVGNRTPYYAALEAADKRYSKTGSFGPTIVEEMEQLIAGMLAKQLAGAFDEAPGQ